MQRLLNLQLFTLGVLLSITSYSQNLRFEHISTREGLSQSNVNRIFQDRLGFIWIATRDGLNRYDGYRFVIYRYDVKDTSSISDDFVVDIAEDSESNLWLATKNGLNKFNRNTRTFIHFLHNEHDPNSLSDNVLNGLVLDKAGHLWIATQTSGLDRFDIRKKQFKHYRSARNDKNALSDNSVRSLFLDSKDRVWVGTFTGGLNCFDPETETFEKFPVTNEHGDLIARNIVCSYEDSHRQLWVGTQDDGLLLLDRQSRSFRIFNKSPKDVNTLSSNSVFSLNEDAKGDLWIGTENGGLCIMNQATKQIRRYLHDEIDQHSLNGNSIYTICRDKQHNVWLGCFNAGINVYLNSSTNSGQYRHTTESTSLSNNLVSDIFEDSRKNLWVGTDGGGINVQRPGAEGFIHYRRQPNGLSGDYVLVDHEMSDGDIYIGTWGDGISIFDPKTGKFRYLKHDPRVANSLSSNNVFAILEGRDRKIWIATANAGVDCYDRLTGKFEHYRHDPDDSTSLSSDLTFSLLEDTLGNLYVGTYDNGLNILDKRTKRFTRFTYNSNYLYRKDINSVSNNSIPSLFRDSRGNVWIGTFHGLDKFDVVRKKFTVYTTDDGLTGNTIFATVEDNDGNIWISTNNGLSVYDPRSGRFRSYTTEDGLEPNEFKPHSALKASNGYLYFGGIHGLDIISPEEVKRVVSFSPVVVTSLQIFNNPMDIPESRSISLPHNQNSISFEFAALDFGGPRKKKYAYWLKEFDKSWNYSGTRNTANYTNLSPGHYQFEIRYQNGIGEWSPVYRELSVTVIPPFWATWWFRAAAIVLVALGVYAFFKIRLNSIRAQKMKLERQVAAKTKEVLSQKEMLEKLVVEKDHLLDEKGWLLKEVHHRVKNNLQMIMSLLNMQAWYLTDDSSLSAILDSKHRIHSISLIHERLYRSDNVAYVNMDSYVTELIDNLCESFNTGSRILVQLSVEPIVMDVAQALPVGLILNEAVTNSIKYAFPDNRYGQICVSLSLLSSGNILLAIDDDGVGFQKCPDESVNSSLGFNLINAFATQLEGRIDIKNQNGVSISLEFHYKEPNKNSQARV